MKRLRLFLGTELPVLGILAFGLGPWVLMMLTSLRPDLDLTHSPISLIPSEFTLVHYIELLGRTSFIYNLRDSLVVASGAVTLGMLLSLPAAYAFSRFRFPGRHALRIQFLVVNMFPVVLLVMTGGGPGTATQTLPLYAFLKAWSGADYGYGSALAVMLTLMLLSVVIFYAVRSRE